MEAEFSVVPVVLSKKFIVLPAIAEDNVAVNFTDWPGVIPPAGIAEPSVLVTAKVIDCGVVFWLIRGDVVEMQIKELFEVASVPQLIILFKTNGRD